MQQRALRAPQCVLLSLLFVAILACEASAQSAFTGKPQYHVEIHRADSVLGSFELEMFPAISPNHVRNWDSLVGIHFYDSTAFHRVIPNFMIQGGDPNSRSGPKSTWGYGDSTQTAIDAEFNSVSHRRGILSAARTNDPNSATSQFFICVANDAFLDRQYTVYGQVTAGMNIADTIVSAKRDANDNPLVKISMFITRTGSNDSTTDTPRLISPVNDSSIGNAVKATLRWHRVNGAMLYRTQLARDSAFTDIVLDSSLTQFDTLMNVSKLMRGTTYYWRVMANNGGRPSGYTDTWKFSSWSLAVQAPPPSSNDVIRIYPNPSHRTSIISVSTDVDGPLSLEVFDELGRKMFDVVHFDLLPRGAYDFPLDLRPLPKGEYRCRATIGAKIVMATLVVE